MKLSLKKYLLILLLLLPVSSFAQQFMIENLGWADGILSGAEYDILQDSQGYIWMAGSDDLTKYDGSKIIRCNFKNNWPLLEGAVYDIAFDNQNALWVASQDTCLFVCESPNLSKGFHYFPEIKKAKCILLDQNTIWCLSENKIYEIVNFKTKSVVDIPFDSEFNKRYAACILNQEIIIGSKKEGISIFDIKQRKFKSNFVNDRLIGNTIFSANTIDGKVYLGHNGFISIYNGKTTEEMFPSSNLGYIMEIFKDNNNYIWVLGYNGISILQEGKLLHHLTASNNDLYTEGFLSSFIDKEQNIWLGSNGSGMYKLINIYITRFSDRQKKVDPVYGIVQDKDDTYWFGYFGVSYFSSLRIPKNSMKQADTIQGPMSPGLNAYDPIDNSIWYVCENSVLKYSNGKQLIYDELSSFSSDQLGNIFFSQYDTSIYVTTNNGLTQIKNGQFKKIYGTDSISCATNVGTSTKHGVYICTYDGIKKIINGQLVNPPCLKKENQQNHELSVIASDKYGSIYTDIGNNTILQLVHDKTGEPTVRKYNLFEIAGLEGPYNIYIKNNYFVLRTFSKVYIIDLESIYNGAPKLIQQYGKSDGINPETPSLTGMFIDNAENLWITGNYGAYRYNFLHQKMNKVEPINHILNIKVNGEEIEGTKYVKGIDTIDGLPINLKLPYNKNEISFEYLGITYKGHERVFYKTRLIGLQDNWSAPFQDRHITYNNLSPGKYTFEFISCNNDGVWSKVPYSFSFKVRPPWYQTTWFRFLAAVFLAAIIYLLFLVRVAQIKKQKTQQENLTQAILQSQEDERKRIAQDLHDGVGQKLSMLKVKAEKENNIPMKEKVADIIEDIRFLSRNIHPHYFEKLGLTKAIEMLVEENKSLGNIYWISELENIDSCFSTQKQLVIFRIIQECMNNILKHSEAKNSKITFEKTSQHVQISLQDNGKGFNLDTTKLHSLGLSTIKERVRSLNGSLNIKTKPGQGTHTIIHIPLGKNQG